MFKNFDNDKSKKFFIKMEELMDLYIITKNCYNHSWKPTSNWDIITIAKYQRELEFLTNLLTNMNYHIDLDRCDDRITKFFKDYFNLEKDSKVLDLIEHKITLINIANKINEYSKFNLLSSFQHHIQVPIDLFTIIHDLNDRTQSNMDVIRVCEHEKEYNIYLSIR